jgi:hypothetical protein
MGDRRVAYRIFVGRHKGKRPPGSPRQGVDRKIILKHIYK